MNIRALGYVGVESPDFNEWEELAPDVFGMGLADSGRDGTCYLRLDDRHHRIAVHPGERNRLAYMGWETGSADEFETAMQELSARGTHPTPANDAELNCRQVERMAHFFAPSGFRYEIFFAAEEHYQSFVPGRPHSGFVTGEQGLGHLVVSVPDEPAETDFLIGVMGFRLSNIVVIRGRNSYFLRVNPRHHSIACNESPGSRGLHHIMVQVRALDDLGVALNKVMDRGMHVSASLGRHATDQMVSFYVRTPGGFDIEYGFDGLEIVEADWVVTRSTQPVQGWRHRYHPASPELELHACREPVERS